MSDKEKRMAAMKKRLKKSTPKISGKANLENMNQIKNFMFGNKKSMGIDDDLKGITIQKAKKKIADSKNKKSAVTTTSKNGKVDVGLQTALKNNKIKTTPKVDKKITSTVKKDNKITPTVKKDNKTTKSKVSATAGNTKNFASTMAMQKKLIAKGAKIKADGIMGPKTRAAMAKFMKAPVPKARPPKTMVDSFKKSNVSANKNKKAGISEARGDMIPRKIKINKAPEKEKRNYLERIMDSAKKSFSGDFKKKTGAYKLVSKGTSNIKDTKLQADRKRKRLARERAKAGPT